MDFGFKKGLTCLRFLFTAIRTECPFGLQGFFTGLTAVKDFFPAVRADKKIDGKGF
jgi:hypothetical protein